MKYKYMQTITGPMFHIINKKKRSKSLCGLKTFMLVHESTLTDYGRTFICKNCLKVK